MMPIWHLLQDVSDYHCHCHTTVVKPKRTPLKKKKRIRPTKCWRISSFVPELFPCKVSKCPVKCSSFQSHMRFTPQSSMCFELPITIVSFNYSFDSCCHQSSTLDQPFEIGFAVYLMHD